MIDGLACGLLIDHLLLAAAALAVVVLLWRVRRD